MGDKVEDILFKAHKEGIIDEVLEASSKLKDDNYYTYGDKIEVAYNITIEKINKKNKK
tara:strand:+ start:1075 stop:1248 length:174 start_codon:yes stop_codon:yes gene_type:complete